MTLIEERRLSKIRQQIRRSRQQPEPAQLKINLGTRTLLEKHYRNKFFSLQKILIEEIGWEAYEWQKR
jgi:hypothetical protein